MTDNKLQAAVAFRGVELAEWVEEGLNTRAWFRDHVFLASRTEGAADFALFCSQADGVNVEYLFALSCFGVCVCVCVSCVLFFYLLRLV